MYLHFIGVMLRWWKLGFPVIISKHRVYLSVLCIKPLQICMLLVNCHYGDVFYPTSQDIECRNNKNWHCRLQVLQSCSLAEESWLPFPCFTSYISTSNHIVYFLRLTYFRSIYKQSITVKLPAGEAFADPSCWLNVDSLKALNRKEHLRHRADSLRQHDFLVRRSSLITRTLFFFWCSMLLSLCVLIKAMSTRRKIADCSFTATLIKRRSISARARRRCRLLSFYVYSRGVTTEAG